MFEENKYKPIVLTIVQILLLIILMIGYFIEFIIYFTATDSFTFFDLPLEQAFAIEFMVFLLLSVVLSVIAISTIRMQKISSSVEYIICISLIAFNILKLIFFLPSISLEKENYFYLVKQFIPIITSGLPIFFGLIKLSEIKYEKYRP